MLLEISKPTPKILQKNKNKIFNGTCFLSVQVARKHFAPGNHLKNCLCKVFFCLTNLMTFKIQFTFGGQCIRKLLMNTDFLLFWVLVWFFAFHTANIVFALKGH